MAKVYLLPGMGADARIYKNIQLPGHELISVDYFDPSESDTLTTYAQKLIGQYNIKSGSVLLGNSLGGMIAVEIAKQVDVAHVLLVSSIKTIDQAPAYFKFFRTVPVYKILPGKLFTNMGFLAKPVFGDMNKDDAWLFNDMLKKTSPKFMKWAMGAALHWVNKTVPPNVHIITGDKDLVFDYKRITDAIIIKGGTHIMIFDKAPEISAILTNILKK